MNIIFWLAIAAFIVIALLFVLVPLWLPQKQRSVEAKRLNVDLYRQKQLDLQQRFAAGELDEEQLQLAENELKQSLLDDTDNSSKSQHDFKPAKWTGLALLVVLPVVSFMLYLHWGSSKQQLHYWVLKKQAKQVQAELKKIKNPQQIVNQLIAHLKQYPNSAKGWYLLGRLYLGMRNYSKALQALTKAHQLQPKTMEYSVAYAQAQFFANDRKLSAKSKQLLKQVIKKMPYNVPAINLLAVNAYTQKNYQAAVNYWERLLPAFREGSRDSRELLSMIGRAQKHLAKHSGVGSASITAKVSVSQQLKSQLQPNDTIFVYARSASSPMPLAVVRKKASDLPFSVKLSAQQAMVSSHALHANESVQIVARVSKSGDVNAHPGDLQSKPITVTLHPGTNQVVLTIDQLLK